MALQSLGYSIQPPLLGAIIDNDQIFNRSLTLVAFLALLVALPAQAHSSEDNQVIAATPAVAEFVVGTVEELVIEDRVNNTTRSYYALQRDDGSVVLLTRAGAEALRDGARVALRGQQDGAHFAVHEVQSVSPPSAAELAARAAAAVQVEGTLAIAHADDFATGTSQYHYHVRDDVGGLTTLIAAVLPPELRGGMRVLVFGRRAADGSSLHPSDITILTAPATGGMETTAGATVLATTTNSVPVILANFSKTIAPAYTAAQAQQMMVIGLSKTNMDRLAKAFESLQSPGLQNESAQVSAGMLFSSAMAGAIDVFFRRSPTC